MGSHFEIFEIETLYWIDAFQKKLRCIPFLLYELLGHLDTLDDIEITTKGTGVSWEIIFNNQVKKSSYSVVCPSKLLFLLTLSIPRSES